MTPTAILASSQRSVGSTRRTVCSFWLATTRMPDEAGAEWLELVIKNASRAEQVTNGAERTDMQHLDGLWRTAYCVPRGRIMPPAPLVGSRSVEVNPGNPRLVP